LKNSERRARKTSSPCSNFLKRIGADLALDRFHRGFGARVKFNVWMFRSVANARGAVPFMNQIEVLPVMSRQTIVQSPAAQPRFRLFRRPSQHQQ
jgi:hypothetical protein